MRVMMSKLKLAVNETKTRVAKLPEEKFDFLGYTFGRCFSPKTGWAYLGTTPSKKRVKRICAAISRETARTKLPLEPEQVVEMLNRMMNGWANYFCLGPVSNAYRAIERHARRRLRQWLCRKHQSDGQRSIVFRIAISTNDWAWSGSLGGPPAFRGRSRDTSSVSRMREIRTSRFDERDVETEHGAANEAPADERAGNR